MTNIHPSWVKLGGIPLAIMEGKHDDVLDAIQDACKKRTKSLFRKGQKCKLVGTKDITLDGKTVTIIKVNQKSISIGVGTPTTEYGETYYPDGSYNVPPRMLEPLS